MPIDSTPPAPKAKRTPAAPKPNLSTRQERMQARADGLQGIGQVAVFGCIARGLWADAATVKMHAPGIARETAVLAEQYEIVAKAVDMLVGVGPLTGILSVGLPFLLQLGANHKLFDADKAGIAGIENPDDLAARMQVETEKVRQLARLQSLREQAALDEMIREAEKLANEGNTPE